MDLTTDNDAKDQLHAMMCSVISKRKKYPALLIEMEKERITSDIKAFDASKVESDDDVYKKELKSVHNFIKKHLNQIPSDSLTTDAETRYLKAQRNMDDIKSFLDMRNSR